MSRTIAYPLRNRSTPYAPTFIKALFSGLLPAIDLGLPDFQPPGWPKYLDPTYYLAPLFQWVGPLLGKLLGWIPDVELGWAKYVIGFLVAVSIAVREVRRRKQVAQGMAVNEPADRS